MNLLEELRYLYEFNGARRQTVGLSPAVIERHAAADPRLARAVHAARKLHDALVPEHGAILKLDEKQQIQFLQDGFVNFYSEDTINPYVPLSADGPWIVTTCGAVVFDAGGYGMLGQGHNPEGVRKALAEPQVMANIMTASLWHNSFIRALRTHIGFSRPAGKREPFKKFLCLNSGSESVTLAMRIADTNAFTLTAPGAPHAGKKIKFVSFVGSFHGRTERPAQASHSSLPNYRARLASFRDRDNLITIPPNDISALERAYQQADADHVFIEALLFEPVMGEGNPGLALDPAFYKRARELSVSHGSILIIDAIQAGLRAHGCLSIVDYPGFEDLDPPDIETYSKALNAGQYPLSVAAFGPRAQDLYARGTYGNTMTTNPRALTVACAVLDSLTPELRRNVTDRGHEAVAKLKQLASEFPDVIEKVQGTGLLFSAAINPKIFKVVGFEGLETFLRKHGFGVIHGASNSLRYTPPFDITSLQIDLMIDCLRDALEKAPRLSH